MQLNEPSVLKRGAEMWATVSDGEDLAVKISSNKDSKTVDLDRDKVTSSDIIRFQNGDPLFLFTGLNHNYINLNEYRIN